MFFLFFEVEVAGSSQRLTHVRRILLFFSEGSQIFILWRGLKDTKQNHLTRDSGTGRTSAKLSVRFDATARCSCTVYGNDAHVLPCKIALISNHKISQV